MDAASIKTALKRDARASTVLFCFQLAYKVVTTSSAGVVDSVGVDGVEGVYLTTGVFVSPYHSTLHPSGSVINFEGSMVREFIIYSGTVGE